MKSKDFFDKLCYGHYCLFNCIENILSIIFRPALVAWFSICWYLPLGKTKREKRHKSFERYLQNKLASIERFGRSRIITHSDGFTLSFAFLFWFDVLLIIPYLIFDRNILPYPFKGKTLVWSLCLLCFVSSFFIGAGYMNPEAVIKKYRNKSKDKRRKAFLLYCLVFAVLFVPFILFLLLKAKLNILH